MVYGLHHSTEKGMTTYHTPIGADERTVTIQHSKEVGHDHVINLPTTFLITGSLRHDPLLIRNADLPPFVTPRPTKLTPVLPGSGFDGCE